MDREVVAVDVALGAEPSNVRGAVVREWSRVYEVDVSPDHLDTVRAVLRRACVTFAQKCVRIVVRGEAEYVQEGETDGPLL